jgi:hypothetical protein
MNLETRFSERQLEKIVDEAAVYMCACPAQVAAEIRRLRQLISYQNDCELEENTNVETHRAIAAAASQAHAIMEECMDKILTLEGWDRETLKMPENLRKQRDDLVEKD